MGLFNGPPVTDAQRDLVAMTDAKTREWYLEAEIVMLNMRIAELEAALEPFADKANEYDNPCFPYHNSSLQTGLPVGWLRQARKVLGNAAADWEAQDRALGEK